MNTRFLFSIVMMHLFFSPSYAIPSHNDITPSSSLPGECCNTDTPFRLFSEINVAFNNKGFDSKGNKVAQTQYLDTTQNALAMIKGAQPGSQTTALAALFAGVGDDGIRGHFVVDADYKRSVTAYFGATYALSDQWWCGAFIPVITSSLDNIVWLDQTKDVTPEDILFENQLGIDFSNQVEQLSNGLSLEKWKKDGFGDITLWFGWQKEFIQDKEWIKCVTPHIRTGMMLPTGVKKDEDKTFFLPFGNDGAPGLLAGIGLTVNLKEYFNTGIDIEFLHIFTTTRERRIKTDFNQTEALLLTKTLVSKDPGFTERFTLFAEVVPTEWLKGKLQYSYIKESESHLYPLSNTFSATVANTAESLKGFTSHTLIGTLDLTASTYASWMPDISVGIAHPFNGRRVIQADHVSIELSYSF